MGTNFKIEKNRLIYIENGVPRPIPPNNESIKAMLSNLKMVSLLTPPYHYENIFHRSYESYINGFYCSRQRFIDVIIPNIFKNVMVWLEENYISK